MEISEGYRLVTQLKEACNGNMSAAQDLVQRYKDLAPCTLFTPDNSREECGFAIRRVEAPSSTGIGFLWLHQLWTDDVPPPATLLVYETATGEVRSLTPCAYVQESGMHISLRKVNLGLPKRTTIREQIGAIVALPLVGILVLLSWLAMFIVFLIVAILTGKAHPDQFTLDSTRFRVDPKSVENALIPKRLAKGLSLSHAYFEIRLSEYYDNVTRKSTAYLVGLGQALAANAIYLLVIAIFIRYVWLR